ncbi:hypothetical protein V8E54_004187 [Elaphomyces granulatus]
MRFRDQRWRVPNASSDSGSLAEGVDVGPYLVKCGRNRHPSGRPNEWSHWPNDEPPLDGQMNDYIDQMDGQIDDEPPPSRRLKGPPSSSEANVSGLFPTSTKKWVARFSKRCWLCDTTPYQFAHVLGKADRGTEVLFNGNFIDFMLDGPENVITLCGACHQNFDHIDDPGWIFHPTDIKYFIQFECHDRERRAT